MSIARKYVYGLDNKTINHPIESGDTLMINLIAQITINAVIRENATIKVSDTGVLTINGLVEENVKFLVYGLGSVIFNKEPPQSVLDNLESSSFASIIVEGKKFIPTSCSKNNNLTGEKCTLGNINGIRGFSIDDIEVTPNDPRILSVKTAEKKVDVESKKNSPASSTKTQSALREYSLVQKNPTNKSQSSLLNDCSPDIKTYIATFKGKEKHTEILKGLSLSEDEKKLLDPHRDPITNEVMNIPVMLGDEFYDFNNLLEQAKNNSGPFKGKKFNLHNIYPVPLAYCKIIRNIVLNIKENHEKNLSDHHQLEQSGLSSKKLGRN